VNKYNASSVVYLCAVGTALFVTGSSFSDDDEGAVFTCHVSTDYRYDYCFCF